MPDDDKTGPPSATPPEEQQGESSRWWEVLDAFVTCGDLLVRAVAGAISLAVRVIAWTVGLIMSSCS